MKDSSPFMHQPGYALPRQQAEAAQGMYMLSFNISIALASHKLIKFWRFTSTKLSQISVARFRYNGK
jgi:hypothetical protein